MRKVDGTEVEARITKDLQQTEADIANLIDTLASGVRSEAIVLRLQDLEGKKVDLLAELAECQKAKTRQVDIADLAAQIRRFAQNFDERLQKADIEEKKTLMKIWIRDNIVDRDRGVVDVNVRKVPVLTIENLNEKGANKKGHSQSCECPM